MKPASFFQISIFLGLSLAITRVAAQEFIPDTFYWESKASMQLARSYFPAAVSDGKIYAIGGGTSQTSYTDKIEVYDPGTDAWMVTATLPQPMNGMAGVELGGAIYIIGGATDPLTPSAIDKVYRFFPATGTFDADTIAALPAARYYPAACAAGGKIYVFGGATAFYGAVKNEVYVYDPALNSWTTLAQGLSIGRAAHSAVVVGNKIYVIGGTAAWTTTINSVEVYDYLNSEWVVPTNNLTNARALHGSAVLYNVIYAMGGIESLTLNAMTVEAFNPEIEGDSWEAFINLTQNRRAFGCVAWPIDENSGYIYIMGGNSGSSVISSTQRLFIKKTVGSEDALPISPANTTALLSSFPNPLDQSTTISYVLNHATEVCIAVHDGRGQLIATPVSTFQTAGKYHIPFDATRLEPGVYWCVMNTGHGYSGSRKMVVLR